MNNELDNPFSVTKATEFSDNEIYDYWVQFNARDNVSIDAILNPTEFLPKYIIGGKGCGKTHILRYYSFPLQKIRNDNNIEKLLSNDNYIGLYSIFHGLNSSRFSGKGISEDEWSAVFEYYFELYICDNLLKTIYEIFQSLKVSIEREKIIVQNILSLLNMEASQIQIYTISDLISFFVLLRRKIDSQILNAAFRRKLDYSEVKVLFSPGDLLFGIPNIVGKNVSELENIKFIYILDEYEKFFEWQKVFINSLVWDKKNPVTFWIGARKYGYTTRQTKSGQEMKPGSEFSDVDLDLIIRNDEQLYRNFAEQLITSRLRKFYELKGLSFDEDNIKSKFINKFELYNDIDVISNLLKIKKNKEFKHIKRLRANLKEALEGQMFSDLKSLKDIEHIVKELLIGAEDHPLFQKYKLFFFYKEWNSGRKGDSLKSYLKKINKEYKNFLNKDPSAFDEIVDKRKKDFLAQLFKENQLKNYEYLGIQEFIKMSQGNSRSFILVLKRAVEFAKIKGEKPLEDGGRISLESQYLAVHDTARWFFEDAELSGENGRRIYLALKKLTDYLVIERFCDKPVDTTVSTFYVKSEELNEITLKCLEEMKMHSFLIEDLSGRMEKNSGRKERKFYLNKILAPLWDLPIVIRGTLSLKAELADSIFDYRKDELFQSLYRKRKSELNAPTFGKSVADNGMSTLF
ncbi:ORC-CDC6 family AAA ATPase [Sphingobacterium siyangense]|uniref:ORC-CDC6 family AAA ATPase n=1 Tax=Sphingobacterium siyangense TaxID=459529 RepID=UPI003DA6C298